MKTAGCSERMSSRRRSQSVNALGIAAIVEQDWRFSICDLGLKIVNMINQRFFPSENRQNGGTMRRSALGSIVVLAASQAAMAAGVVYSDRGAFEAAVGAHKTYSFDTADG